MDINKHISGLLFKHECVIVPGLGGFVSNYAPAKIHPVHHLFQPPSKTILFNPELKNNDGLLTNTIAGQESISYPEALVVVDEFSKNNLAALKSGNKVKLDNIGVLYSGIEGNILFRQDEKSNYLMDTYGLSSYISPIISRNYRGPAQKPATKFCNRRNSTKPNKTKGIGTWAFILIPLFIILGWISMNTRMWDGFMNSGNGLAEAAKAEHKIEAITDDKAIADNSKTVAQLKFSEEKSKTRKPEIASFVPELSMEECNVKTKGGTPQTDFEKEVSPDPDPPAVQVTPQKMYYLIGGSFENIANAKTLIASCKEQGYVNPKVIGQAANGFYRVSITAYVRKPQAINELQKVWARLNPRAWLLRQ